MVSVQSKAQNHHSTCLPLRLIRHRESMLGSSSAEEDAHHNDARSALRAVHNLGPVPHARAADAAGLVGVWLEHRSPEVVEEAIGALGPFEGWRAEALLLRVLEKDISPAAHARNALTPGATMRAAVRTLRVLAGWQRVSARAFGRALRLLVQLPNHGVDLPRERSPCVVTCRRACNPHVDKRHCKQACMHRCTSEATARVLLGNLLAKGAAQHNGHEVLGSRLLRRWRAKVHPSWHPLRRRPKARQSTRSAATLRRVIGPLSADRLALVLASGNATASNRRRTGWFDDINFDDFSLTFVDLKVAHTPYTWGKQWGEKGNLGVIGSAMAGVGVNLENGAWLRLGLFGGGFGFHADNWADASCELGPLKYTLFKVVVQFKFDATYRVDLPLDLLEKGAAVVQRVVSAAESIKGKAAKGFHRMLELGQHLVGIIGDFVERLDGKYTGGTRSSSRATVCLPTPRLPLSIGLLGPRPGGNPPLGQRPHLLKLPTPIRHRHQGHHRDASRPLRQV